MFVLGLFVSAQRQELLLNISTLLPSATPHNDVFHLHINCIETGCGSTSSIKATYMKWTVCLPMKATVQSKCHRLMHAGRSSAWSILSPAFGDLCVADYKSYALKSPPSSNTEPHRKRNAYVTECFGPNMSLCSKSRCKQEQEHRHPEHSLLTAAADDVSSPLCPADSFLIRALSLTADVSSTGLSC